jgi:GNAT superfamily N-acetyltransferase
MKVEIIPAPVGARGFVFDSFVKKFSRTPQAAGASRVVVSALLEPLFAAWATLVAVPEGDRDTLLGWVLFEPKRRDRPNPVIAWVYVVEEWQRRGIGRALVDAAGLKLKLGTAGKQLELHSPFICQKVSDDGPAIAKLAEAHGLTYRYRPYLPLQVQLDALAREAE